MASPLLQVDPRAVAALRAEYPSILEEGRRAGHDVDRDPYLQLDPDALLRRYLVAVDGDAKEAARRIRATVNWRREFGILECYEPGAARQLFNEETNPGSEMYFSSSCHVDRLGRPYIAGRGQYCNSSNLHPWRHLRAGVFVTERMAVEVIRRGCGYGSYVLDIGDVPEPGVVSGTGGGEGHAAEGENPYLRRHAGLEAPAKLVEQFGELRSGMAVLRAAITIANAHYPELAERIIVLRSNWLFASAARIFTLWMHKRTREKFVFARNLEQLKEWYPPEQLPDEWGGTGWKLDGDGFMAAALDAYDAELALFPPRLAPRRRSSSSAFAGWDEIHRAKAEKDALERGYDLPSGNEAGGGSDKDADGAPPSPRGAAVGGRGCDCFVGWPCLGRPPPSPRNRRSAAEAALRLRRRRRRTRSPLQGAECQTSSQAPSPGARSRRLAALLALSVLLAAIAAAAPFPRWALGGLPAAGSGSTGAEAAAAAAPAA